MRAPAFHKPVAASAQLLARRSFAPRGSLLL